MEIDSLVGQQFGSLRILEKLPRRPNYGSTLYLTRCVLCNEIKIRQRGQLTKISSPHTGCSFCAKREAAKRDYLGRVFGGSTVTKLLGSNQHQKLLWEIACGCGSTFTTDTARLEKRVDKGQLVCPKCRYQQRIEQGRKLGKKYGPKDDERYFWENRYAVFTSNARKRGIDCDVTLDQFKRISSQDCTYCGVPPQYREQKRDNGRKVEGFAGSIDRKNSAKSYTWTNIVPACDLCNRMKSDDSAATFLDRIEHIGRAHLDNA